MTSKLKNWTTTQVLGWFRNDEFRCYFGADVANKVVNRCAIHKIDGQALRKMKAEDFCSKFGITMPNAKEYFKRVKAIKSAHNKRKAKQAAANKTPKILFQLNVFIYNKTVVLPEAATPATTIEQVQRQIIDTQLGAANASNATYESKLRNLELTCKGFSLLANKTLGYYDIKDSVHLIVVKSSLRGGSDNKYDDTDSDSDSDSESSEEEDRERIVNTQKFAKVKKTSKVDCITLEGDEGGSDRALMPCGHAISPDTMYNYIVSIFLDTNVLNMRCPVPECDADWDWQLCTQVADMTMKEYLKWTSMRERRLAELRNEKACPWCKVICKKPNKLQHFRMACNNCSGGDWCWECCNRWNHSGNMICGNDGCNIITHLNKEVSTCKTIREATKTKVEIYDYKTKQVIEKPGHDAVSDSNSFLLDCPLVRACPRCLNLVTHVAACKHMFCGVCNKEFCWFCLALYDASAGWPCGSSGDDCSKKGRSKAGIQQFS